MEWKLMLGGGGGFGGGVATRKAEPNQRAELCAAQKKVCLARVEERLIGVSRKGGRDKKQGVIRGGCRGPDGCPRWWGFVSRYKGVLVQGGGWQGLSSKEGGCKREEGSSDTADLNKKKTVITNKIIVTPTLCRTRLLRLSQTCFSTRVWLRGYLTTPQRKMKGEIRFVVQRA